MTIRFTDLEKSSFTEVLARPRRKLVVKHPGELLRTEFLEPHLLRPSKSKVLRYLADPGLSGAFVRTAPVVAWDAAQTR